jgi:DmsE family decaheme c-type cytochrome
VLPDPNPMRYFSLAVGVLILLAGGQVGGDTRCSACHGGLVADFQSTAHAISAEDEDPSGCTSCHGDPAAHLAAPTKPGSMLAFDDEPGATINAACGSCHADAHSGRPNPHSQAGLACTDCHSIHQPDAAEIKLPAGFDRLDAASATCFECHQETFGQFAFNERHRLQEGSVSCTSCHDPHAPTSSGHLGAFGQRVCAECHADADGPFVFEHGASKVEGCGACHEPHGSPNRHMLTHQQVGELCYSCHAIVPQFHLGFSPAGPPRFDEGTVCTNCHATIHGSNLDPAFLR